MSSLDEQMMKSEERERRRRQFERDWHLYIEEINLLQEKLNKLKERKGNFYESIEEQLNFIRVKYFVFSLVNFEVFGFYRIKLKN